MTTPQITTTLDIEIVSPTDGVFELSYSVDGEIPPIFTDTLAKGVLFDNGWDNSVEYSVTVKVVHKNAVRSAGWDDVA